MYKCDVCVFRFFFDFVWQQHTNANRNTITTISEAFCVEAGGRVKDVIAVPLVGRTGSSLLVGFRFMSICSFLFRYVNKTRMFVLLFGHTLQLHPKSYGVMCEERVRFTQDAGAKREKLQVTIVLLSFCFVFNTIKSIQTNTFRLMMTDVQICEFLRR